MEIILESQYYEGAAVSMFDNDGDAAILGVGCGA
jgi:hypothetical protein